MALPSVKNATFTIKVKEFKKPVMIRPMLMIEHKSIQQVTDIGSEEDVAITIANVTAACTDNMVTADKVPQYVLDFIFMQIYVSSVESVVNSRYRCYGHLKDENGNLMYDEEVGDQIICDNSIEVRIPLGNATVMYPDNYDKLKVIDISDTVKLHLKSLSLQSNLDINTMRQSIIETLGKIEELSAKEELTEEDNKDVKIMTDILLKKRQEIQEQYFYLSVDYIEDADGIYRPGTDFDFAEFLNWTNNCPSSAFVHIEDFYNSTPTVGLDLKIECPACGNKSETNLRGLKDFFS